MTWLLWKEYRENRLICIAGAVILLLPYAIASIVLGLASLEIVKGSVRSGEAFLVASLYSLIVSQLTLALLGGNAIAGERADRSAEFLAYLPLSRGRMVVAKLLLALLTTAVIWCFNWPLLLIYHAEFDRTIIVSTIMGMTAVVGFTFFCVSWLVSSLQSSPTFAVCAGLVLPWFVMMVIGAVGWLLDYEPTGRIMDRWFVASCLVLAVTSFAAGTWYYLRRVEP